jgi:hypothetical protein
MSYLAALSMRSAIVFLAAMFGFQVHAGEHCYTAMPLKDQKGKALPIEPVCRALENNLNEFCDVPPLVCGLKIAPKYSKVLEFPKWTPVDLGGKLDLVESVVRGQWERAGNPHAGQVIWHEAQPRFEVALRSKRLMVFTAQLDLYGFGKKLKSYRINPGDCEINNGQQLRSKDHAWWNTALTSSNVEVLPSPDELQALEHRHYRLSPGGPKGDLILFRGKPYWYDMWGYTPATYDAPAVNRIGVNLSTRNVCDIKYKAAGSAK